ncbi:phytanoyl-CoA dioxygenase family protein [Marimonas lutisalis]|uniref:phytanoyl-CoA dioxygenase family protein n=1 Tax=Marimonas lutisalis TaxID=2545756 RepID=UPI0010F51D0A|nr:phytanoyl-CoA dioxygenase family protein [Marimonas lutisalis]
MPAALTLDAGHLPQPLIEQYWRDGFLFPIQAIPAETALSWRAELERIERDWLAADLPHPINTYKRMLSNVVMTLSAQISADPRILDVVEGLIGPDIMVFGAEYFIKEPQTRHMVTMHQDLTYWGLGATDQMVTVWLALSPATPASGCMDFVAGSHKNPILPHEDSFDEFNLLSRGQEVAVDVSDAEKTAIELMPGQISLHHGLTIHGSGPNTSDDRRIACVIRYVAPGVLPDGAEKDYAMLVRGADRTGNFMNFAPPARDFEPAALALFDEIRTHQAAIKLRGAKGRSSAFA